MNAAAPSTGWIAGSGALAGSDEPVHGDDAGLDAFQQLLLRAAPQVIEQLQAGQDAHYDNGFGPTFAALRAADQRDYQPLGVFIRS